MAAKKTNSKKATSTKTATSTKGSDQMGRVSARSLAAETVLKYITQKTMEQMAEIVRKEYPNFVDVGIINAIKRINNGEAEEKWGIKKPTKPLPLPEKATKAKAPKATKAKAPKAEAVKAKGKGKKVVTKKVKKGSKKIKIKKSKK